MIDIFLKNEMEINQKYTIKHLANQTLMPSPAIVVITGRC
jgi:hypothetical protein